MSFGGAMRQESGRCLNTLWDLGALIFVNVSEPTLSSLLQVFTQFKTARRSPMRVTIQYRLYYSLHDGAVCFPPQA